MKKSNSILTPIHLNNLFKLFISVMLLTTACEKQELETSHLAAPSTNNQAVLQSIVSLGFIRDSIQDLGDSYLVEGDILFDKKMNGNLPFGRTSQYNTNNLVYYNRQTQITVRVDASMPTSGEDNWIPEIKQALEDWNNISDRRVRFVYTTNATANITIQSDKGSLSNTTIAAAQFPNDGGAGYQIRINFDFHSNRTVTSGQKRYNMVHELGHCIGFRHTNGASEGSAGFGLNLVIGTPSSDGSSVMNGGTALYSWVGFSKYDIEAVRKLYPSEVLLVPNFYLDYYKDLKNAFGNDINQAHTHLVYFGYKEGRMASPAFKVQDYLARYSDLRQAFGTNYPAAVNHWLVYGINEGRSGSPAIDVKYYLSRYPDLQRAYGSSGPSAYRQALYHWLTFGIDEGRAGSAAFNPIDYKARYSDIRNFTNRQALYHWLIFGISEGRIGS